MATVLIPVPLRKLTNGVDTIYVTGNSIISVIDNLEAGYPGMKERLCNEHGAIRQFINVYLNNEDIRFKAGLQTLINETDEISIVPAMAGG
jgi:molybdopterin synthase sulfur carrier subunit